MAEMVNPEDLVGTGDAADALGISNGTLRRLTKKGHVPGANKVAGRWVFDLAALQDYEIPESALGSGRATRRADGRIKYGIFLLPDEAEQLAESGYDLIDRQAKREARREAKKAVKDGLTTKGDDETWYDVYDRISGEDFKPTVSAGEGEGGTAESEDPFEDF